jgi:PPOX class probable F420-dependent enzyme
MKRRDVIRMSDAEVDAFLQGRHTMNVATINPDGTIHLVAMWYGFLDGKPGFWTYGRSQKVLNLERNPQVTCLVESGDAYEELQGVELVGRAELVTDRDRIMAIGRSVFQRYIGPWSEQMQPYLDKTGAKRVGVLIDVDRTISWDHRKLGGTY